MSWEEVGKINSDYTREPLNFNNYINDISMFGKYSYVLDPENSKLWRSLLSQSLTMFGHSTIHDTVYERLTDDDVDYMIRHNARLGQAFNSFYSVNNFTYGRIDSVLRLITAMSYNVLETKLQCGINRYVSEMTAGDTAGEWLGTVFEVDALKAKTNMASIISDATLWTNVVMVNESLRYVICLSATAIDWFANNDSAAYIDFINEVCNSTQATIDLFTALNGNSKLTTFMETESVVTIMESKAESMTAVLYHNIDWFDAFVSSDVALRVLSTSEIAQNLLADAFDNAIDSSKKLEVINTSLTTIQDNITSLKDGETVITDIEATKEKILNCTTKIDIISNVINKIFKDLTILKKLLAREAVCCYIANSEIADEVANMVITNKIGTRITNVYVTDSSVLNKCMVIATIKSNSMTASPVGYFNTPKQGPYTGWGPSTTTAVNKMFGPFTGVTYKTQPSGVYFIINEAYLLS